MNIKDTSNGTVKGVVSANGRGSDFAAPYKIDGFDISLSQNKYYGMHLKGAELCGELEHTGNRTSICFSRPK